MLLRRSGLIHIGMTGSDYFPYRLYDKLPALKN